MTALNLRTFPESVRRELKVKAAELGVSMTELAIALLRQPVTKQVMDSLMEVRNG